MKLSNLIITDGYTREAFISSLYGDLRFSYRPCLPEQRASIIGKTSRMDDEAGERLLAVAIAKQIKSWNVANPDAPEEEADITGENIVRFPPDLLIRLASVVIYGSDKGDNDPERKPTRAEEEAAASGKNYADSLLEGMEKN